MDQLIWNFICFLFSKFNITVFTITIIIIIIIRVFCLRAGPLLQAQEPRLQFCRWQVFHRKLRNQGCSSAEDRSSTAKLVTKAAVLLGMNRCGSFPLLSAPHSLFSIWTDLNKSEKILEAPAWMWGEWIWLTGSSGLHQNSPHGLNITSIRVFG